MFYVLLGWCQFWVLVSVGPDQLAMMEERTLPKPRHELHVMTGSWNIFKGPSLRGPFLGQLRKAFC